MDQPAAGTELKRTLGPLMLWGLGVGYVISGMYFGWNLGLAEGGTLGLAIATVAVIIMYVTFTLSYTELTCMLPRAGGAFVYAQKALGDRWGFLAGSAQIVEFAFAPPAIAMAIGAYGHLYLDAVPVWTFAVAAYLLFTALNIFGVKAAALFELAITVLAVVELLIFAGIALPSFSWPAFSASPLPNGWGGVFAAMPFAIWFFLAIEGIANVAEETVDPQRNIIKGFGWAIFTLVILCILTFTAAVGVGGWEAIVYPAGSSTPSDSPLPLALGMIVGENSFYFHLLVTIGIFGLVASFHGIMLVAGRAFFEFGRAGFAPRALSAIHPRFQTPHLALILNLAIGLIALGTGHTGELITMACLGACTLYIISMVSLFVLRRDHPELPRPFLTPGYPLVPAVALGLAVIAMLSLIVHQLEVAVVYAIVLAGAYASHRLIGADAGGKSPEPKPHRG